MTGEYFCRPKESLHCVYITKDNVEEFIEKYCGGQYITTMTDRFAYVKYKYMTWNIRLNAYMVYEYDGWTSYTKEEFDEMYEVVVLKEF